MRTLVSEKLHNLPETIELVIKQHKDMLTARFSDSGSNNLSNKYKQPGIDMN